MSTDSLPRPRSSVDVLGAPQRGRERVVAAAYWIGMLAMAIGTDAAPEWQLNCGVGLHSKSMHTLQAADDIQGGRQ